MEFNWKIVSVDDTSHTMLVDFWNEDNPNPVQMNILKPEEGIDINEYMKSFSSIVDKPVKIYQTITPGIEGTSLVDASHPEVIIKQEKNTLSHDFLPISNSTEANNLPSVTVV